MIRFKAEALFQIAQFLEQAGVPASGAERLERLKDIPDILPVCTALGLKVSAVHAREVNKIAGELLKEDRREPDGRTSFLVFMENESHGVADTIRRELQTKLVFCLPDSFTELFENPRPFDTKALSVNDRFPEAVYDIQEAANCLALSRPTASVCHLMRVLEVGLRSLAADLGVPWPDKENWQDVINAIEGKIKLYEKGSGPLPADWKDKRQFYGDAATQFTHFKDGWRNYAMHYHAIYDDAKAHIIFMSVQEFMRVLATRLSSVP